MNETESEESFGSSDQEWSYEEFDKNNNDAKTFQTRSYDDAEQSSHKIWINVSQLVCRGRGTLVRREKTSNVPRNFFKEKIYQDFMNIQNYIKCIELIFTNFIFMVYFERHTHPPFETSISNLEGKFFILSAVCMCFTIK